jgi:hypothetical protein
MNMAAQHYIVHDTCFIEQFNILKGTRYSLFGNFVRAIAYQIFSQEKYFAGIGPVDTAYQVKNCGLSRPIWADNGKDGVFFNAKIYIIDRLQTAELYAEVFNFQDSHFSKYP